MGKPYQENGWLVVPVELGEGETFCPCMHHGCLAKWPGRVCECWCHKEKQAVRGEARKTQ